MPCSYYYHPTLQVYGIIGFLSADACHWIQECSTPYRKWHRKVRLVPYRNGDTTNFWHEHVPPVQLAIRRSSIVIYMRVWEITKYVTYVNGWDRHGNRLELRCCYSRRGVCLPRSDWRVLISSNIKYQQKVMDKMPASPQLCEYFLYNGLLHFDCASLSRNKQIK